MVIQTQLRELSETLSGLKAAVAWWELQGHERRYDGRVFWSGHEETLSSIRVETGRFHLLATQLLERLNGPDLSVELSRGRREKYAKDVLKLREEFQRLQLPKGI